MPAVPLEKFADWSPFTNVVWNGISLDIGPITKEEVRKAIDEGRLRNTPVEGVDPEEDLRPLRREHVERIAFLVVHRDPNPIELDVGVPHLGCYVDWPVMDGHHRLAAAIYRGDATIEADVSGSLDYGEELLGVRLPRTVRERVLEAVRRCPGRTLVELAPFVEGVTKRSVASRLSELCRSGLVVAEGRPRRYALSGVKGEGVDPRLPEAVPRPVGSACGSR